MKPEKQHTVASSEGTKGRPEQDEGAPEAQEGQHLHGGSCALPLPFCRLVVEETPDVVVLCREGRVVFINGRIKEVAGFTPEEIMGRDPLRFIHPDDRLAVHEHCLVRAGGKEYPAGCSFRMTAREGDLLWVHMKWVPVFWEGAATLCVLRDMTDQNRLEARQIQAQKLEALGTLADGIAHDFNNLLMGIQGYASLALMEGNATAAVAERIKKIQELVRGGAALTAQLLGFSGNACYENVPVNLNDIASGASLMMEHFNREISIHRNVRSDLWPVMADRGQMEQVVMNLMVNAGQSMPGGGDLYIETANEVVTFDSEARHSLGIEPGRYVRVSLTDTGMGIDETVRHRLFDPFFSTREAGSGAGLGLPSAYGIVRAHGGTIDVTSRPGHGARFDVYIPAAGEKCSETAPGRSPDVSLPRATILIVDDEERILEVNRELLESQGYRIFQARSGREAIALYERCYDVIDLVILDLVMPGMSGAETYGGLREINRGVKVILLSGYSIEGGARELLRQGCRAFVQKPFLLDKLEQTIQEVLHDHDEP